MSREDLEEYWKAVEGHLKPNKFASVQQRMDFIQAQRAANEGLEHRDPLAARALGYAAQVTVSEGSLLATELYSNTEEGRAVISSVGRLAHRKLSFFIYDTLREAIIEVAKQEAPIEESP